MVHPTLFFAAWTWPNWGWNWCNSSHFSRVFRVQRLETRKLKPHYVERPGVHPFFVKVSCIRLHPQLSQTSASDLPKCCKREATDGVPAGNQQQNHPMKSPGRPHLFQKWFLLSSHPRFWQHHPGRRFPYHRCLVKLAMFIVGFITVLALNFKWSLATIMIIFH